MNYIPSPVSTAQGISDLFYNIFFVTYDLSKLYEYDIVHILVYETLRAFK